MKLINKILVGICLLAGVSTASLAQHSVTVDVSQNITNFSFTNSAGEAIKDYNPAYSGSYALGYRYSMENGLFFPAKLGMRKAGASYIYDTSNYIWDLRYADARLGVGYNYSFGEFAVHASVSGYYAFLLKANQVINNEHYDIKESGQISNNDFGVFISPGVNYSVSEHISLFLDLNYMMGLQNLETSGEQESANKLFGASVGVAFTL
ncbi:outer membrane beta-barrel protein [Carboxylicivirga sp. M1479]|uniref:outer membrane beta-barrel protein n=1 Tax=Carboxylicivirga sp. M1479 TaxID=2594476 RepID=UPI001177EA06|nr:outer membrane beta-barrel protein [Carboxylicivirga sp. M1479]TRX72594.1 PorT family protein [Carboxylicivirga sp. M1479]